MVTRQFIQNVEAVVEFFGLNAEEYESFKVLCRGNPDAAETFVKLIGERVRRDPRFRITQRIRDDIAAEKLKNEEQ